MLDRDAATARREALLARVREARPEDAAQMGCVFVDSYLTSNRGIFSEAHLAGRSPARSAAAWLRGCPRSRWRAARAAGVALPPEERRTAKTVFCVAGVRAPGGPYGTGGTGAGEIAAEQVDLLEQLPPAE
jgi:hypothetical protein